VSNSDRCLMSMPHACVSRASGVLAKTSVNIEFLVAQRLQSGSAKFYLLKVIYALVYRHYSYRQTNSKGSFCCLDDDIHWEYSSSECFDEFVSIGTPLEFAIFDSRGSAARSGRLSSSENPRPKSCLFQQVLAYAKLHSKPYDKPISASRFSTK